VVIAEWGGYANYVTWKAHKLDQEGSVTVPDCYWGTYHTSLIAAVGKYEERIAKEGGRSY
jgi:hypothetical protein